MSDYSSYLILLIGLSITLNVLLRKPSKEKLKTTGKKAEAIIFNQESQINSFSATNDITSSSNIKDKVTIRFVTESQEWITSDIQQDFAVFYNRQYKNGETVTVYYDPLKPSDFYVETKQSPEFIKITLLILGLTLIGIGFYMIMTS